MVSPWYVMRSQPSQSFPVAPFTGNFLTIAGSDSGGQAGLQRDLQVAHLLGYQASSVVSAITAQNPVGIVAWEPVDPHLFQKQLHQVWSFFRPTALKTGMIPGPPYWEILLNWFNQEKIHPWKPGLDRAKEGKTLPGPVLVVDPVARSTSGTELDGAETTTGNSTKKKGPKHPPQLAKKEELFRRASLITPNIPEAEGFLSATIASPRDQKEAARELARRWESLVYLKGGHLAPGPDQELLDIVCDGHDFLEIRQPFRSGINSHGSGCLLATALACCLDQNRANPNRGLRAAGEFLRNAFARGRYDPVSCQTWIWPEKPR